MTRLVGVNDQGLYCAKGDFYVDPWHPVENALITHGHSDHARWGSQYYLGTDQSREILQYKLGRESKIATIAYGEKRKIGKVWVSFHPAGHILGSAQIRIEHGSDVVVVSGDYKRYADPSCTPFEVVPCETFITEATFALPIYHWTDSEIISGQIMNWWQENASLGETSVIFCYALGKAQHILSMLAQKTDRKIYTHGAVLPYVGFYANQGIKMLEVENVTQTKDDLSQALVLAPLSADGTPWMKRFKKYKTASASGWMMVRGNRRWQSIDKGFVLSDHADWNELLATIKDTQAKKVLVTHGDSETFSRYLRENLNIDAEPLQGYFFENKEDEN